MGDGWDSRYQPRDSKTASRSKAFGRPPWASNQMNLPKIFRQDEGVPRSKHKSWHMSALLWADAEAYRLSRITSPILRRGEEWQGPRWRGFGPPEIENYGNSSDTAPSVILVPLLCPKVLYWLGPRGRTCNTFTKWAEPRGVMSASYQVR